jgi:hypothetical protein
MTAESMQDSTVPVGDKSMTFEVRLLSSLPVFTSTDACILGTTTPMA